MNLKSQKKKLSQRAYKNLLYGLLHPNTPSYLILYVNNICQLRCDMCFYWDSMQVKTIQLSTDEIEKISKSFPNLFQLTLTGGEPTLRKDLPRIPEIFSKNSNLSKCTLVTNGMLYERINNQITEMVERNPEIDFRISISIDGIDELHDKIRGVKGSYKNAIKTAELLFKLREKKHNLWVDMNTTISKYNYKEFKDIHSYILNNFNVDNHVVAFARGITKEKDAKDIPVEYYEEYKKIIQKDWGKSGHVLQKATAAVRDLVMDEVNRELKENTHNFDCSAGKKFIEIYQDGKVATCEILETIVDKNWDTSLGKIQDYDYDINKLLKAQKAKEIIKYIKEKKCHCTFECPKHMDVLYNKKFYPKLLKKLMHYYI